VIATPLLVVLVALGAAAAGAWAWENARRRTHPVPAGLRSEIRLPHEREFELHHNAFSLCSMKTRLCLAELSIPYASHPVDLIETGAYENIRPAFLAVNPAGTVPVLVHRGHPVYESHEQIRHAADHAPPGAPALVPEQPDARAEMQRWIDRSSLTGDPMERGDESAGNAIPGITVPIFAAMIERVPWWRILEGLLFHYDKRRPLVFLALKWRGLERLGDLSPVRRAIARSLRQLASHLDALEEQLDARGGPWILGERFSLADVSWLVIFERLAQVDALESLLAQRPLCAAWWERLRQRPAYREAIAGHAHPAVARGTRRLVEAKAARPALRTLLEGGATEPLRG
jgi:glutathione S-transferase